ncbi:MAG: endolytic transglycosylase MltG [Bacilli bacterium]|nr:endolytic transglycosylase MltG [Bacilli bacterium]
MKGFKKFLIFCLFLIAIASIGAGVGWMYFTSPVNPNSKKDVKVEIKSNTNSTKIAETLKRKDLIKSILIFKIYLKVNNINNLKASNYTFNKSMTMEEIVDALQKGVVTNENDIKVTFKDGLRVTDYATVIANNFNKEYDIVLDVFKDREYAKTLIEKYWFLTDKILDESIYYPLEGYLAPETYYFEKDSTIESIIIKMLDQTETILEDYKEKMSSDPHYYMTMASIVQLEGTNSENRKMITGVFENRLNSGMNLGSDVTTYYALQESMTIDLTKDQFNTENQYNTRGPNMIGKMPIGPICNPNAGSIEAAVNPTANEYYFFVADKNGEIYFTKTNAEHDQKVAELKANGLWIEFSN